MRLPAFALLALLALLLTSCGDRSGAIQPPTIQYGRDLSEHGMIISDERFAAAALPASGDPVLFDDTGELLKYRQAHPQSFRALFVHDYQSKQWLPAEQSWYLLSARLTSPMGWGLAAFTTEAAARDYQGRFGGEVLRWPELTGRSWTVPGASPTR